jgi:hypothetical protein
MRESRCVDCGQIFIGPGLTSGIHHGNACGCVERQKAKHAERARRNAALRLRGVQLVLALLAFVFTSYLFL